MSEAQTGSIPWADHPLNGDDDLRHSLTHHYAGADESTWRFEPVQIALDQLEPGCAPEDYLISGDENGYETTIALMDAYERGESLPPITVALWPDSGALHVLDGFHRQCAAQACGMESIPALRLVSPS